MKKVPNTVSISSMYFQLISVYNKNTVKLINFCFNFLLLPKSGDFFTEVKEKISRNGLVMNFILKVSSMSFPCIFLF